MAFNRTSGRPGRLALRTSVSAAAFSAALALAACSTDDLLKVNDPDVTTPGAQAGEQGLPVLRAGALSDFQIAYSGSNYGVPTGVGEEGQINLSGLFTDEFLNSETFPTRIEVDQREITVGNVTMENIFRSLSRARAAAERAADRFAEFDPNTEGHAEVLNLAGFAYVFFGENYCSGVPYSTLTEADVLEFGDPQTTDETFARAIAKFDAAATAAVAAGSDDLANLAAVGKGRTLLDMGDVAGAAAAVAAVPTDFQYFILHSVNSVRQENGVYEKTYLEGRWAVSDVEGVNGMPFISADDPRVQVVDGGVGFDGSTPLILQTKYPERFSPVVLADGVEARYIEAEAALGNPVTFLALLNEARAAAGGSPALTAADIPATTAGRVDLLFRERAFSLFLTSHRLGDLRRLVRQYGRAPETVYPTGDYFKGGEYGTDYMFPIPQPERNNPNLGDPPLELKNCLDRSP